jgi:sec-independent protein translocase protein TatA
MGLSVWHVVVVLAVVLILFGAGKLPQVMGDMAKGIKNFKAGLADDEAPKDAPAIARSSTAAMPEPANSDGASLDKTASGGKV